MKILNGLGTPTSVVLGSERYVATARRMRTGDVRITVRKRGRFERWLMGSRWFFPRFLRLLVLVFLSLPKVAQIVIGATYIGLIVAVASAQPQEMEKAIDAHFTFIDATLKFILFCIVAVVVYRSRGHHASEHMAIHAFERYGRAGIDHIREQSRLHPMCGGRLAIPGMMVGVCSILARMTFGHDVSALITICLMECVLWVDTRVGIQTLPFFGTASLWVQRVFTTREPTEQELQVGAKALSALYASENATT